MTLPIIVRSLPDCFGKGMTLIVLGGLGRGFVMGFKGWPDNWRFSFIQFA